MFDLFKGLHFDSFFFFFVFPIKTDIQTQIFMKLNEVYS